MVAPRMTAEMTFERTMPGCPHCGADMERAAVTLFDIVDGAAEGLDRKWMLRIDSFVPVDFTGYADADKGSVVALCPVCDRPSVLAMSGCRIKLVAARTDLDRRFLERRADPCPEA